MKYNFCAGPSMLPREVFENAAAGVLDFDGSGLSILEMSHRSKGFQAILSEAEQLVRELMGVPQGYSVLFLQGGASGQFAQVPLNLLPDHRLAGYVDTGVWANKAIKEARKIGQVEVLASSADRNYSYIPREYDIPEDLAYLHLTSNNTIYGTELFEFPETAVPIVSDMSSDIFSREVDVARFGLIYAGAQKNVGPAGMVLVIVRDDLLGQSGRILPSIWDYQQHAAAHSLYHTPPVFAIYVAMLNLRWLKQKGGVSVIEQENIVKARVLYEEIDRNPLFRPTADPEDRSRMNVVFVAETPDIERAFLQFSEERGLVGLKGHRSVGGFRASIYNAMSIQGVNALVDAMQEFEDHYEEPLQTR